MFLGCETHTISYLLFTYVYSTTLVELHKKSNITKLQIAYHKMFLGMSKYESTSYLCTLVDIQCCQSLIRKLVYGFMCRLDSSVNYNINGILATSSRYTSRICKHGVVYYILLVDRTTYTIHIVYNLLHVIGMISYYYMNLRLLCTTSMHMILLSLE